MTAARPRSSASSTISRMIRREVFGSRLAVGSSTSSSLGRCIIARAIPTRCLWPPERASARLFSIPDSPRRSSNRNAWSISSCGNRRNQAFQNPTEPRRPDRTFSITVNRSTRANSWKIMPIPRRARRSSREERPVISTPSRRIRPADGSTSRLTQRIRVLFPAPEGPMTATTSPAGTDRSMPSRAREPEEPYFFTRPWILSIGTDPFCYN